VNSFITKSTQQHGKKLINLFQLEADAAVVIAVSAEVLIITGGIIISKTLMDGMTLLQKNDETLARDFKTLSRDVKTLARDFKTLSRDVKTLARDVETLSRGVDSSLQALSKDIKQIKMDSDDTKNKLSTIVVSLGLFFAILGGSKTLFEAIEF
jgi:outer membrane murein-binding lipoprotein Lpp